jgi:hypothetical protein
MQMTAYLTHLHKQGSILSNYYVHIESLTLRISSVLVLQVCEKCHLSLKQGSIIFFCLPWRNIPHYRGFVITLRHSTLGRTPLDE